MSTYTKDQLIARINQVTAINKFRISRDPDSDGLAMDNELFAIAQASLEAEAVMYASQETLDAAEQGEHLLRTLSKPSGDAVIPLYTAPQSAPVVPDLKELEAILDWILLLPCPTPKATHFAKRLAVVIDAFRAAMQGKAEPVSNRDELPATIFKPVADLYGITSPTGSETTFTFDAVEARDFIDGGYSVQEYVELERYQQAVVGNSPVIPDGWVSCSERMPHIGVPVITCCGDVVQYAVYAWDGKEWQDWYEEYDKLPASAFTHWHSRPASPQQEVK